LGRLYDEFQAKDTDIVVIGGGGLEDASRLQQMLKLHFPVLADPDRSVYRDYGLGKSLFVIQRSATILVDKKGRLRFLHQVTNPYTPLPLEQLWAAINDLEV